MGCIADVLLILAIVVNGAYAVAFALAGWPRNALICIALGALAIAILVFHRKVR